MQDLVVVVAVVMVVVVEPEEPEVVEIQEIVLQGQETQNQQHLILVEVAAALVDLEQPLKLVALVDLV